MTQTDDVRKPILSYDKPNRTWRIMNAGGFAVVAGGFVVAGVGQYKFVVVLMVHVEEEKQS